MLRVTMTPVPGTMYLIGHPWTKPVGTAPARPPWGFWTTTPVRARAQANTRVTTARRRRAAVGCIGVSFRVRGGRVAVANPLPGERRRGRIGSRGLFCVHGRAGIRPRHTLPGQVSGGFRGAE